MSSPAQLAEATQLALGVVAARSRGDLAGAETLLDGFGPEVPATAAFLMLSELALGLVRSTTGQSTEELVQELTLIVENALTGHAPD